jgi:hypothetical protein
MIDGVRDERWAELLGQAWRAVAGESAPPPAEVQLHGSAPDEVLAARLPVADAAIACIGTALLAAARLGGRRAVSLDVEHVAAAVRSEVHLRLGGQPHGSGFAPLSRFWRTADGWARTHANYPWHRSALLAALNAGGAEADAGDDVSLGRLRPGTPGTT